MPVKLIVALFVAFAAFVIVGVVGVIAATYDDGGDQSCESIAPACY